MKRNLKFLGQASILYGLSTLVHKVLSFVLLPVYTRYLSPSEYGVFAVLNTTGALVKPFLLLGFGQALIWCVVFRGTDERKALSTGLTFVLAYATLATLLLLHFAPAIAAHALGNPATEPLLRILFPTLFAELLESVLIARLRLREQAGRCAVFVTARIVLYMTLQVVFLAGARMGVEGLLTANLIAALISGAAAAILLAPALRPTVSLPDLRGMLVYGTAMVPISVAGIILTASDRLFLQKMATSSEVGLYALGYNVGMAVNLLSYGVQMAWLPRMFKIARGAPDAHHEVGSLFSYYVLAMVLIGLGLSLLGAEVVALVTPEAYRGASAVIPLVAASYILNGVGQFTGVGMATMNKLFRATPIVVFAAVCNLLLNALLIPRFGIMGAAWATLASYAAMTALLITANQRLWRIRYEPARLAKIAVAAGGLFAAGRCVDTSHLWLDSGLKVALTAAFPFLLWALRFFKPEETAAFRRFVGRLYPRDDRGRSSR